MFISQLQFGFGNALSLSTKNSGLSPWLTKAWEDVAPKQIREVSAGQRKLSENRADQSTSEQISTVQSRSARSRKEMSRDI